MHTLASARAASRGCGRTMNALVLSMHFIRQHAHGTHWQHTAIACMFSTGCQRALMPAAPPLVIDCAAAGGCRCWQLRLCCVACFLAAGAVLQHMWLREPSTRHRASPATSRTSKKTARIGQQPTHQHLHDGLNVATGLDTSSQVFAPCQQHDNDTHNTLPATSHPVWRDAAAAEQPSDVTVPHTIWQTVKTREHTPAVAACFHASWQAYNPGWSMQVLNDTELADFMRSNYNVAFVAKFQAMPFGVMRADVFRCADVPLAPQTPSLQNDGIISCRHHLTRAPADG